MGSRQFGSSATGRKKAPFIIPGRCFFVLKIHDCVSQASYQKKQVSKATKFNVPIFTVVIEFGFPKAKIVKQ
jgi:hypothetical protein